MSANGLMTTALLLTAIICIGSVFVLRGIENTLSALPLTLVGLGLIAFAAVWQRMVWALLLTPIMLWPISAWLLVRMYLALSGDEPLNLGF